MYIYILDKCIEPNTTPTSVDDAGDQVSKSSWEHFREKSEVKLSWISFQPPRLLARPNTLPETQVDIGHGFKCMFKRKCLIT